MALMPMFCGLSDMAKEALPDKKMPSVLSCGSDATFPPWPGRGEFLGGAVTGCVTASGDKRYDRYFLPIYQLASQLETERS
jgi:hypothetical protein